MSAVKSVRRHWFGPPLKISCRQLRVLAGLTILLTVFPRPVAADDVSLLTQEAERLAWPKNWARAEPLWAKIEAHYQERGDTRGALYAEISRLRGQLPHLSLIATSNKLANWLEDPLVQSDTRLRLRC